MKEIQADHLVVGAGILGLSVADHLLRRGAERVVILEAGRAPGNRRAGQPALILETGLPAYRQLEERALVLLEEWAGYLEVDPRYRRCGSIRLPYRAAAEGVHGMEPLDAAAVERRCPGLRVPEGEEAAFRARDGLVDRIVLVSALHWQVRKRGGQLYCDSELQSLTRDGGSFLFGGGARFGRAQHVHLAAGVGNVALTRTLSLETPHSIETWHSFELGVPVRDLVLVRLGAPEEAVLLATGDGDVVLSLSGPPDFQRREPRLDWQLLEEFRRTHAELLPILVDAQVRRGRAENVLGLDRSTGEPLGSDDGALIVAPPLGIYGTLLALSVGERMAEISLGK